MDVGFADLLGFPGLDWDTQSVVWDLPDGFLGRPRSVSRP